MRRKLPFVLGFCCALIMAGCDEKTAPEPPNEFTAILTGALNDTVSGPGIFGGPTAHQDFIRLTGRDSSGTSDATIIIQTQNSPNWTVGTHAVGNGGAASLILFSDPFIGDGISGTVTITSSTPRTIAGRFNVTFRGQSGGTEGTVSGTFRAKCASLPDRTCVSSF